ncbi:MULTISPECIES: hypothetical protein [Pseudomonas]|uniref:Uncharacterized protein n=2 Tax=Pseudomonas TaxID=286 RepID=A0A2X2CH45_PSELU|nr:MULTISPECIES: hypothetical protein [Pseudomonas]SER22866.1 hypothetical protein SAMN05216409_11496 [Pseudomonas lutea]SPZ04976.1 Uncharacterised protein [Pseudomonas luteola]
MTFMEWLPKNSSELAAWIQAIGSIGAICVAVAIPAVTSARQRRAANKKREARAKNIAVVMFPILMDLSRSLACFCERHDPQNKMGTVLFNTDPDEGDFQKHIPQLMSYAPVLDDMPETLAEPIRVLMKQLIILENTIKSIPGAEHVGLQSLSKDQIAELREEAKRVFDVIRGASRAVIEAAA